MGKHKNKRKHQSGTPEKLLEDKRQKTLFECLSPVTPVYSEEKVKDMAEQNSDSLDCMLEATKTPGPMEKQMEKVVELLEVIVNRFQPELQSMKDGLNVQQTEIDDLRREKLHLEERVNGLEGNLARTEKVIKDLQEEVLDLKARSMRDNIIIQGIKECEKSESREKLVKDLRKVLAETLKMPSKDIALVKVDRCHRIGAKKDDGSPRPVVYKITPSWAKELILNNTRYIPKGSSIKVFEQFPNEIQERRKQLIPVLKENKTAKKKAKLAVDKLIIEGKPYRNPATPTLDMTGDAPDIKITHTETLTEQGSSFQGHIAPLLDINHRDSVLHKLYSDKRTAMATHNIWALRIKQGTRIITSWADDGEYHAGRMLAEILEDAGAENKMVMVSRWYGGSHMGKKRFDCIKHVANQAISQVSA